MQNDLQQAKKLDKLYSIQKIQSIIEENGIRYGVVKWQNFSNRDNTKEPIQQLRTIVGLRQNIEQLQRQFDLKSMENKIKKSIKRGISQQLQKMYRKPDEKILQESSDKQRPPVGKANQLSIYERSKVDVEVNNEILRRARLGLRDLKSKDYFYFMKLRFKVEEEVYRKMKMKIIPKTDELIDKVNSFYRNEKGFRFCVTVKKIVYSCSTDEMLELFPINFLNYLNQLTTYLKIHIEKEIEESEKMQKSRKCKLRAIQALRSVISIKQTMQTKESPIYFGLNRQQAENNRKTHENRLQGIPADSDNDDDDYESSRSRSGQNNPYQQLQRMYKMIKGKYREKQTQITNQMKSSNTPQKTQKREAKKIKPRKDQLKMEMQLKNLQRDSSGQNNSNQKSGSNQSSIGRRTRQKQNIYQQNQNNQKKECAHRNLTNKKPTSKDTSMDEEISSESQFSEFK